MSRVRHTSQIHRMLTAYPLSLFLALETVERIMRIVLATNNTHKIREIQSILAGMQATILTLQDFPGFVPAEETGTTLEENAILKARTVCEFTGLTSLADDSGLEVDALKGAPGVKSSRFAGEHCSFADNNRKLLRLMERIPTEQRGAKFVCVVAVANRITTVRGEICGIITFQEKGENGFGYDPVFLIPELNKTFAQLSMEDKNRISHRAAAFRKAGKLIQPGSSDD
jgi:XTP/dITP diphosphohydrolase